METADLPPSYESIVKSVDLIPDITTLGKNVLQGAAQLAKEHQEILANEIGTQIDKLSETDKQKLGDGLVQIITSDQGKSLLKDTASKTNEAITEARQTMSALYGKLNSYDSDPQYKLDDNSKFAPKLKVHMSVRLDSAFVFEIR